MKDAIIAMLMTEFEYTEKSAGDAVQKLQTSNPAVQEVFERWWTMGELDAEMIVEGYTLQTLVEKKGLNPFNACLILDTQALRQSQALEQNGLTGRWEFPTEAEAARAIKMFEKLGITNIDVKVVPLLTNSLCNL